MSADQARILAELAELLRPLSEGLLPGEEVTAEMTLVGDLGLQSIHLANLSGRIQSRYGGSASLVPFFIGKDARSVSEVTTGEIADYIARVTGVADPDIGDENVRRVSAIVRTGLFDERPPGEPAPENENAAVLAENAPETGRTVLRLPRGTVEVFTAGKGPALILMHPINVGAGVFARLFASLADRYHLVCVHNPGVGATTWDADLTLEGLARLYRTVLTELSIAPPFHVLGSSFGGIVAQQFALLHPSECATLVLFGSSYRTAARGGGATGRTRLLPATVQKDFDRVYGDGDGDERAEAEELVLRCESMETRLGMRYLEMFLSRPNLLARLPGISVPTLVVRGVRDTMVPPKDPRTLASAIPGAEFVEMPEAGHFPYLTHPAEAEAILTPFLAGHAVTARAAVVHPAPPVVPRPPDRCGIIFSSGRCGSTLLSELINDEPETLSGFETLAPVRGHLMYSPLREMTGAEYWALCSEMSPQGSLMTRLGIMPKQFAYPGTGRWSGDLQSLPPILYVTLPKISPDPDRLFDLLAERVPDFPVQPPGQHHRMLLDLIADIQGRRRWVERSGASSLVAYPWLEACLDANVVYLTRNIEDTARSMSKHASFQFAAVRHEFHLRYGADPYSPLSGEWLPDISELPPDLQRLMPDRMTADTLRNASFDIGVYEQMVAHMNGSAEQALNSLKPERLHRIRYEGLLADPVGELEKLGAFLGFADPSGWARKVAPKVGHPRGLSVQPA
jgi:pimeloyl-ACP methyl ester carboxylesterase